MLVVSLCILLLAAGCLTGPSGTTTPEEGPPTGPGSPSGTPEDAESDPSDRSPSGEAMGEGPYGPPVWTPGDWFTWQVASGPAQLEATTVVAGVTDGTAAVGFTDLETGLYAQWFHLPPAGSMGTEDLSWDLHDEPSSLIAFPLEDGATWEASFEGESLTFSATRVAEDTAPVFRIDGTYPDGDTAVRATYSVEAGQFLGIELLYGGSEPWAQASLVDHGSGFQDPVHVLEGEDLFVGGSAPPTFLREPQTLPVSAQATHLLLGCQMGGIAGTYRVQLDGPSGQSAACDHQSTEADWTSDTQIRTPEAEAGDWVLTMAPGTAQGFVFAEVVAVTAETVEVG